MKMSDVIKRVEERTGLSKKDVSAVVAEFTDVIVDAVISDQKLNIKGFGTFKMVERSAREGINPKTKESIKIKASKSMSFKVSDKVKEKLRG